VHAQEQTIQFSRSKTTRYRNSQTRRHHGKPEQSGLRLGFIAKRLDTASLFRML
jgi:hypothetical protein